MGMQGKPVLCKRGEMAALARMCTQSQWTGRPRAGRSLLVLNQFMVWCDVTDRARAKPGQTYEGTRYCRAIQPIACAAAGVNCLGWGKLLSLVTFFARGQESDCRPAQGQC